MTPPRSILYGDTLLAQGGLMRCCIQTIREFVDTHITEDVEDGLVLDCKHEPPDNQKILLDGTVWRWNRPKA